MASTDLFTREEVLQGLPGRRASALLLEIEAATTRAAEARQRVSAIIGQVLPRRTAGQSPPTFEEDRKEWLAPFSRERQRQRTPTIQEIERFSQEWAYLIPDTPRLRAAVAHLLGQKYRFTRGAVPGIRRVLGLDSEAVQAAYSDMYGRALEALYAPQVGLGERLRWQLQALGAWVDGLPPFWIALIYGWIGNFTEGVLVLPIAAATVGPLRGLLLLAVYGAANALTMGFMAEAVARSGSIAYRNGFLGRLAYNYLGPLGSHLAYYNSMSQWFLVVLAGHVGLALTLSHFLGLPPALVAILWAAILIYRLWRIEHHFSITGDLLLGIACVGITLLLSVVALTQLSPELVAATGEVGHGEVQVGGHGEAQSEGHGEAQGEGHGEAQGEGHGEAQGGGLFGLLLLAGVFGGMQTMYYGHNTLPATAKLVLPRDPSGRSLIWGSVAGILCAMVVQGVWLFAITSTVPPSLLLDHAHTAAEPLGDLLGPIVTALAVLAVCLFIIIDGVGASDMLFNLVRERLPVVEHSMALLPRGGSRLLFYRPRGFGGEGARLGLTYLGLDGSHPRFRLDVLTGYNVRRTEITLRESWKVEEQFEQFPELRHAAFHLALEPVEADEEKVRLLITTSLQIEREGGHQDGLNIVASLDLRGEELRLLRWILAEQEASVQEAVAAGFGNESRVRAMLATLEARQMVEPAGQAPTDHYRPRWTRRHRSRLPESIWQSLEELAPEEEQKAPPAREGPIERLRGRLREALSSESGRFILGVGPVLLALTLTLALLAVGRASFVGILAVGGVLALLLASGVFPVLLLTSTRRKGVPIPAGVWQFLGHPLLRGLLYLFFMGILILHGLYLWHYPLARAAALLIAGIILLATLRMALKGAFAPRLVIELREELRGEQPHSHFRILADGRPLEGEIILTLPDGEQRMTSSGGDLPSIAALQRAAFQLPASAADELRLWLHRVTPEGDSETLPALAEVQIDDQSWQFDLGLSGGELLLPLPKKARHLQVTLSLKE